jgi:hypothetical protein
MKRLMFVIVCAALAAAGCSQDDMVQPPAISGPGVDAKSEDTAGNNLSFPVIWSDGYDLALRGTYGDELFGGASVEMDGQLWYEQQDALNQWQAESRVGLGSPQDVDWIDWGDNLEAKPWPDKSKVRVETVLYKDLATPMTGYTMGYIRGLGIDEMWGTNGVTYDAAQANVYSHNARLTIQKLPDEAADLDWSADLGQWVRTDGGALLPPCYNSGVWEGDEGPFGGYSAEINIKGKVIYGMLWDLKKVGDGPGVYRLTFSLDSLHGTVGNNTLFDAETAIVLPVEEGEKSGEPGGGVAVVRHDLDLTYVDVEITPSRGRGGNAAKDPDDGGGPGGGYGGGR